ATEAPALRDVSLEVAQGEIVALVGAVGAGASTVLLAAGDLAPRLTGGRIVGTVSRRERSAIVLPTPWTQVSGLAFTVWDEVAFGPANLGWPTHEIARQVDRALEHLELGPLATRDPATLSGGELQRVIIAATLAMDSGLVPCDAGGDSGPALRRRDFLLRRRSGAARLVVRHHPGRARRAAGQERRRQVHRGPPHRGARATGRGNGVGRRLEYP